MAESIRRLRSLAKGMKHSRFGAIRFLYRGLIFLYGWLSSVKRFFTSADYRAIVYSKLFKREALHQTTTLTCMDRYPEVFSEVQGYFGKEAKIRILSYGCSTGEEVLTLRGYFPNAEIVGADINLNCLKICRSRLVDDRIFFIESTDALIASSGPYDVIFCMAVLQREPHSIIGKGIMNLSEIYPFERFERQLLKLDESLNGSGLMVIYNTQYRLMDTSIAPKFEVYGELTQKGYVSSVFRPDGERRSDGDQLRVIYRKMETV